MQTGTRSILTATMTMVMAAALSPRAMAQEPAATAPAANPYSAKVTLNQDRFFGFYPIVAGSYQVNDTMAATFYSILWTIPAFGAEAAGQSLWTEVGGGASFALMDGKLNVNPQLGLLSGKLLSGGKDGSGLFGEGVVPSLTANHDGAVTEGEIYAGYYIGLRGESNAQNDFLHYWVNFGYKILPGFLSVGVHWEHLRHMRVAGDGEAGDLYRWLGGYVQASLPNGVALRLIGGADLEDGASDFYKAVISMAF